jgi:DNA modification methylase
MPRSPSILDQPQWESLRRTADLRPPHSAVFIGDAQKALARLPAGSVNTCLTSPPYWLARDYEHPDQIGQEKDVEDYVAALVNVFSAVRRVLAADGTAWLNLGDSYYHNSSTVNGLPPPKGWKRNKQLSLVPFRVALALQEDGWWLRNCMVWHKPNAMPSSVRDRLTNTWEPVFLLAKSERYYFDLDNIRIPHKTDDLIERRRAESGGNANGKAAGQEDLRRWLNSPRHRVAIEGVKEVRRRPNSPLATELAAYLREALARKGKQYTLDWVADQLGLPFERTRHYFRTDRIGSRLPPEDVWHRLKTLLDLDSTFDEAMAVEIGDNVFRNHPLGRNPGDMLSVSVTGGSTDHFAMMPRRLSEWALKATLPPGGVCLDPFMGVGTTGLAAVAQGGRFVGIDVRRDYAAEYGELVRRARPRPSTRDDSGSLLALAGLNGR